MLPRWGEVSIRLKNGDRLEQRVTTSRGDAQDPLTDDELVAKAVDCFSYGECEWSAEWFASRVLNATALRLDDVLRQLPMHKRLEILPDNSLCLGAERRTEEAAVCNSTGIGERFFMHFPYKGIQF